MQLGQTSAKIYQFPTGGRASIGSGRADSAVAAARAVDIPVVEFGCGWYHDAAIEEEAARNRPTAEVRPFIRH